MSGSTDLRTHHPTSLGGTINSARMTLDSIRMQVDLIDLPQISFFAKLLEQSQDTQPFSVI